jgi:hypothetical protein
MKFEKGNKQNKTTNDFQRSYAGDIFGVPCS